LGVLDSGTVFPLYHVLADAGEWRGGELVACESSAPLVTTALAVRTAAGLRLLVANLTPAEQAVTIEGLPGEPATLRRLTAGSAPVALAEPERFRAATEPALIRAGRLTTSLAAYEALRIDFAGRERDAARRPRSACARRSLPVSVARRRAEPTSPLTPPSNRRVEPGPTGE
jgi:hypothetical protein